MARVSFELLIAPISQATSAAELRKALTAQGYSVLGDDELNFPSGPEARGWLEIGDLDQRGHQLQNDLPRVIQPEIERPP